MENKTKNKTDYKKLIAKKITILVVLLLLLLIFMILSLSLGSANISFGNVLKTLFGQGTAQLNTIIFNIRLPRIIAAIVVGFALSLAGCIMQNVLRNPLASASTLGVSQGASFGAAVAIIILGAGVNGSSNPNGMISINNPYLVSFFAFLGGIFSVMVILLLSRFKKLSPSSMILTGVALSSLFSGGSILIQYFADEVILSSIVYWTFGNLGRMNWLEILIVFIICCVTFIYFIFNSWNYNALQSGSDTAKSLGVGVNSLTLLSMLFATLLSATAVAFAGLISFVGLVAPHMVRKFIGNDYRFLIPGSALMGAILLLLSDLCGRMIIAPVILPIGAITSFLGAPLFIYFIIKGNNNYA